MLEEYEKKRQRQVATMRSVLDYAMGVIVVLIGVFLFFREKVKMEFNENYPPNIWDKIIGGVFVLYGIWRIYRGYKKNYFQ